MLQQSRLSCSVNVMVRFGVFRAVVPFSFFTLSTLSPSAYLPFHDCLSPVFTYTEGDYFSSVCEFQLAWKGFRYPQAVGVTHK